MLKKLAYLIVMAVSMTAVVMAYAAETLPKVAIVSGGDPKPDALLALAEAKLFELQNVALLEREEIDKVLAEQKLSGMFSATNAVELGQILKTDLFAVLETTSIVIFDAQTGLRFVDETLSENIETAAQAVAEAVTTAVEKRQKLGQGKLVTFGVLEVRNADFPVDRDAWCRAVAGMLERSLLHRGGAMLERSRLQLVNQERQLTGDDTNDLLASMKLIDLEFTRGQTAQSFRITARIGDQTYRAESPIDKPLDAVQEIAGELLGVTESQEKIDTAKEAARFLAESKFLQIISRYEASLEKAETAAALDPENEDFRLHLAASLIMKAVRAGLFTEEYRMGRAIPSSQEVQQALAEAIRIQNIIETLPQNNYSLGYNLCSISGSPRRGVSYMDILREQLVTFATDNYPELKNEVDHFNRRYLEFWMENRYRPIIATKKSEKKPSIGVMHEGCFSIFSSQLDIDLARCYEEILNDWIEVLPSHPKSSDYLCNTEGWILIENITLLSGRQKKLPAEKRDASVQVILGRIAKTLENDPRPMVQHFGWIVRHDDGWVFRGASGYPSDRNDEANRYFHLLRDHIADTPYDEEAEENIEILYESLRNVIFYCCNRWMSQQERFPFSLELLRLVDSRGDRSPESVTRALNDLPISTEPKIADEIRESIPEYIELIERQIEKIERTTPEQAAKLRNQLNDKLWNMPIRQNLPPWSEEVLLVDESHFQPIIRENKLYYFHRSYVASVPKISLGIFDSTTGVTTKSMQLTGYGPAYPWADSDFGRFWVDDVNAYCGDVDNGVLVFPLDGSVPWTFGPDDGLPSGYVQAIASFHGKLYLALGSTGAGKARETAWLVRADTQTKEIEVLASSSGREGKAPFFNIPPPRYNYFFDDSLRNRLLLDVASSKPELSGLWAIDGETERFTQLSHNTGTSAAFFPDGNRFVMFSISQTTLLDMSEKIIQETILTKRSLERNMPQLHISGCFIRHGTVFRDWLWGGLNPVNTSSTSLPRAIWGRVALDGQSEWEQLPIPKVIETSQWCPTFCSPTPDGNGLLVGDGKYLVLLRFE